MEIAKKPVGFASLFNFGEIKRQKAEKGLLNFNNWCLKNPSAAGKEKIYIPEKTRFEKFYKFKREKAVYRDRSFELFYL